MNDILERLRWSGQDAMTKHLSFGMAKLHADAIDEIERLRDVLEVVKAILKRKRDTEGNRDEAILAIDDALKPLGGRLL